MSETVRERTRLQAVIALHKKYHGSPELIRIHIMVKRRRAAVAAAGELGHQGAAEGEAPEGLEAAPSWRAPGELARPADEDKT